MVKKIRNTNPSKSCTAKGFDLRVHFKNTYETGKAIKGMLLRKAQDYLNEVINHTRCVPFTKYEGSTGRTGQAKEWKLTKGRWPVKSCRIILSLLTNIQANAESKRLDLDKLVITRVNVNQAQKGRRRTFRAHGRINAYMSNPCHIDIIAEERRENVKKAKTEKKEEVTRNPKKHIRRAVAKALHNRKYVEVGGKK